MQPILGTQLSNNGRLECKRRPSRHRAAGRRHFPPSRLSQFSRRWRTARRPLGVSELGALLGLPKPTAHRIVRMLERKACCSGNREAAGSCQAPAWCNWGWASSRPRCCAPRATQFSKRSLRQIGETCNFGVMTGSHVIYLDRVESAWPFGLRFEPGSRVPLHCTSMGKLFLSQLPAQKRALCSRSIPLYRYTENTITEVAELEAELETIRATGISIDNQEFLAGVVCVAVPVCSPGGQRVAALAISAPLARMSLEQGLQHVPLLRATADRLTATIDEAGRDPNGQERV